MAETTLSTIPRRGDETDRQFILSLFQRGTINNVQVRALSRRYDEVLPKAGTAHALEVVLAEFDAGEIEMDREAATRAKPPTLSTAPQDESPKTQLLWLHERGTLTMDQVRQVAALLTKDDAPSLSDALREIGARAAFSDEQWGEVATVEAVEPEVEPEADAEFSTEQMAAADQMLAHPVRVLRDLIPQVHSLATLDCLMAREVAGQNRSTVIDAISHQTSEVMSTMDQPNG